jgi:mannitol/fructose-specific phosphotransferase system IIA component (Ntr-type)
MILIPKMDDGAALLIFADITKTFQDPELTQKILQTTEYNELLTLLNAPNPMDRVTGPGTAVPT